MIIFVCDMDVDRMCCSDLFDRTRISGVVLLFSEDGRTIAVPFAALIVHD